MLRAGFCVLVEALVEDVGLSPIADLAGLTNRPLCANSRHSLYE